MAVSMKELPVVSLVHPTICLRDDVVDFWLVFFVKVQSTPSAFPLLPFE
jgi:hypothetical protein